jgi:hypothetical protein
VVNSLNEGLCIYAVVVQPLCSSLTPSIGHPIITKYHPDSRVTRLKLRAKLATMLLLPLLFITAVNTIFASCQGQLSRCREKSMLENTIFSFLLDEVEYTIR